jgi:hypothetical protein
MEPTESNASAEGRAQNRRVEIRYQGKERGILGDSWPPTNFADSEARHTAMRSA